MYSMKPKVFILPFIIGTIFLGSVLTHTFASSPVASEIYPTITITQPSYLELVNSVRSQEGLAPLSLDKDLEESATAKACDMRDRGYFEHVDPDGNTPWHFFTEAGYVYDYAGENLAIGYTNPMETMEGWMNSPKHRDNILDPNYTEIGIGFCGDYTVQHFAAPYD